MIPIYNWTSEKQDELREVTRKYFKLPPNEPSVECDPKIPVWLSKDPLEDPKPEQWKYNVWYLTPVTADIFIEIIPNELGILRGEGVAYPEQVSDIIAETVPIKECEEILTGIEKGPWRISISIGVGDPSNIGPESLVNPSDYYVVWIYLRPMSR